jgi:molybdopterin converting factor small subunit
MGQQRTRKVVLKFFGNLAKRAGMESQILEVDGNFKGGVTSVRERIEQLTGGTMLYMVVYNGVNIALVDAASACIKDGDEFQVVPVSLGG